MKELLALVLISIATQGRANEIKDKIIKKVESEAKKIKIVREIDKLATHKWGKKELRFRPDKITFKHEEKDYKFNITTNGKDSLKIGLKLSF